MKKLHLLSGLLIFFSLNTLAINNCLEEAEANVKHTQATETIQTDYLKIDSQLFNQYEYPREDIMQQLDAIPTIQTHCWHTNPDYLPIENGVFNGLYFVLFKGYSESDGGQSYQIEMALYDTKTLRRHIIEIESISSNEGLYRQLNSSLHLDEITFYAELLRDITPKEIVNEKPFRKCTYLGPLKENDIVYEKGEIVFNCQEYYSISESFSHIINSQADWYFENQTPHIDFKGVENSFRKINYSYKGMNLYSSQSEIFDYLSHFDGYLQGSPFFHEGSIEQIVDHYADESITIPEDFWLGIYAPYEERYRDTEEENKPYSMNILIAAEALNLKYNAPTFVNQVVCDNQYKQHYQHDLLVLEYQGDVAACKEGDNKFIILKWMEPLQGNFSFAMRGSLFSNNAWHRFFKVK